SAAGGAAFGRITAFRALAVLTALAAVGWLATGFITVPPESRGYPMRFGALQSANLEPGLHWHWPAPVGQVELRRVHYPRKADVGYTTDMAEFDRVAARRRSVPSEEWHSPAASMNPDPEQASYLTADENLVEMSFSVHYSLSDPAAFFYTADHSLDFIELYAEAAARRHLAGSRLDELFTEERPAIEAAIARGTQERIDALGVGVRIERVSLVDIHPPGESVFWFRDVSSSLDDKQTVIHQAKRQEAERLPLARGEAAMTVAMAEAAAAARTREAAGEAESFTTRAGAVANEREILEHLLWLEASERHLAGRDKVVVPPATAPRGVTVWRSPPSR
ncbi:MAG: SPFH domain-containing protein, partial [Acidobacteriota bacterium]